MTGFVDFNRTQTLALLLLAVCITLGTRRKYSPISDYIRFKSLRIELRTGAGAYRELLALSLRPLNKTFDGAEFEFYYFNQPCSNFIDASEILNFLGTILLQVFDHCRKYKFRISINSVQQMSVSAPEFLAFLLQLRPISECSNLEFSFGELEHVLPVEQIVHWLYRPINTNKFCKNLEKTKYLHISSENMENTDSILTMLKKVSCFRKSFHLLKKFTNG